MQERNHNWDEHYSVGDLPWDTGKPDRNLGRIILDKAIAPCRAMEFGCGTGTNSIWLAQQGFNMTSTDISEAAIKIAVKKAAAANVVISFEATSIVSGQVPNAPFKFIFDRGCFHSLDSAEERATCAKRLHQLLDSDGLWLSFIGNADDEERDVGPPKLSALEIMTAVESSFEILILESSHFDSDQTNPPRSWICLMRKRS